MKALVVAFKKEKLPFKNYHKMLLTSTGSGTRVKFKLEDKYIYLQWEAQPRPQTADQTENGGPNINGQRGREERRILCVLNIKCGGDGWDA